MQVAHASDDVEAAPSTVVSGDETQKSVLAVFDEIMQPVRKQSPGSWFGIIFAAPDEPDPSAVSQTHVYAAVAYDEL